MAAIGNAGPLGFFEPSSIALSQPLTGYDPETQLAVAQAERKRRLANMMVQQGLNAGPTTTSTGRFLVPRSITQNLANLAMVAGGVYGNQKADTAEQQVVADEAAKLDQGRQRIAAALADQGGDAPLRPGIPAQGPGPAQITSTGEDVSRLINAGQVPDYAPLTKEYAQRMEPHFTEGPQPVGQLPDQGPVRPQPTNTASDKYSRLMQVMASGDPRVQAQAQPFLSALEHQVTREDNQKFQAEQKQMDRENRLAVTESQLNQALMMGLITKDQKDQMLALQTKAQQDTAAHQKEMERLQNRELGIKEQQVGQGKVPPGYRQAKDGNLEAIPGGPADLKLQGQLNADTAMLQGTNAAMDRLSTAANGLLNHPGLEGITGLRGKVPDIPGSAAANARADLNNLKSQIAFTVMQELRNNSKSGSSGLGALSDAEGKRLEAAIASLDTTQDPVQFKAHLQDIINYANGAKDRLRDAFNMKHKTGEPVPMAPTTQGPQVGTVQGGYRFKGGDPAKPESWEKAQ